jgi:hypothetical protein
MMMHLVCLTAWRVREQRPGHVRDAAHDARDSCCEQKSTKKHLCAPSPIDAVPPPAICACSAPRWSLVHERGSPGASSRTGEGDLDRTSRATKGGRTKGLWILRAHEGLQQPASLGDASQPARAVAPAATQRGSTSTCRASAVEHAQALTLVRLLVRACAFVPACTGKVLRGRRPRCRCGYAALRSHALRFPCVRRRRRCGPTPGF